MITFENYLNEKKEGEKKEKSEKTTKLYDLIATCGNSERVLFDLVEALPDAAFNKAADEISKNYGFTDEKGQKVKIAE